MKRGRPSYDLLGKRFGRLLVLSRDAPIKGKVTTWSCKCDCGNTAHVVTSSLVAGLTKSCGCLRRETVAKRSTVHGGCGTRLYTIWSDMRLRCYNPNAVGYEYYGGRGITVCNEWLNSFESFRDWSVKHGYSDDLTIDRVDNDGNYEPNNCRWATYTEQNNNSRNCKNYRRNV